MSSNGTTGVLLAEDLGRECFLGYEDADEEEIRGMVRLFSARAAQAATQQRKAFERLASTAESFAMAQKRLQQMCEAEMEAEDRADNLEEELESSQKQLQQAEWMAEEHRMDFQKECLRFSTVHSELQSANQACTTTESLLADSRALAERRHSISEQLSEQVGSLRMQLAAEAEVAAMAHAHHLAAEFAQEQLAGVQAELVEERVVKSEDAARDEKPVGCSGSFCHRYFEGASPNLRYSRISAASSDLAPSELDFVLGSSLELTVESEPSPAYTEKDGEVKMQSSVSKPIRAFCVTQDPVVAPTSRAHATKAASFAPASRHESITMLPTRQSQGTAVQTPKSSANDTSDDVTVTGLENGDDCIDASAPGSSQDVIDTLARQGQVKGAGVRFLLGRKGSQGFKHDYNPDVGEDDGEHPCEPLSSSSCMVGNGAHPPVLAVPEVQTSSPRGQRSSWDGATSSALNDSSEALVDELFDQCLERAGGKLQGAASVRRVLVDLAGEDSAVPPQLDALLRQLNSSLDAEVSRAQFRTVVRTALALRKSHEILRYESTGTTEVVEPADGIAASEAHSVLHDADAAPSLRQSARLMRLWTSLPSWSMELGRLSCVAEDSTHTLEAHGAGSAAQCWAGVEVSLERLREIAETSQLQGSYPSRADGMSLIDSIHDLQGSLGSFVRCFTEEARGRLRAAHASTGRLLEQKRRVLDDMNQQLDARSTALQTALEESAGISARLRAVQERCSVAETLAADTAAQLATTQEAFERLEASTRQSADAAQHQSAEAATDQCNASVVSLPGLQNSTERSLSGLAELVTTLKSELDAAEQQRQMAEAARQETEDRLKALERRYEEDGQTFHAIRAGSTSQVRVSSSLSKLSMPSSGIAEAKDVQPGSLLEELKGFAQNDAYEQAVKTEELLRSELQEARDELEQHWEEEKRKEAEQESAAAADVAAIQSRLSQMHAGTQFQKVSFKRNLKQSRYVRLTFDCRRIEWAQTQRGPFNVMPVNAILRVDFGDASRAYRCYEFGRCDRPAPGRCFSICTPSRSLDLIAPSEREVEAWVLGLNEVTPYRFERQRFTAQEFLLRRAILRLEDTGGQQSIGDDVDCSSNGTSSMGVALTTEGSDSGRSGNSGFLRAMPGRWGLQFGR